MKITLDKILNKIFPLTKDVLDEVVLHSEHLEYPKNYILLKQGRTCKFLWFMTIGAVRYFYTNEDGKEMNTWFSLDQQIVTDVPSLVHQSESYETIQLIEDSEFFAINYDSLQMLLQKHHNFALWYIKLVELNYVSQIEERIADLQFLAAKQRYQKLLIIYPDITNRVILGHIASYLNITQETLSRIRAGKI